MLSNIWLCPHVGENLQCVFGRRAANHLTHGHPSMGAHVMDAHVHDTITRPFGSAHPAIQLDANSPWRIFGRTQPGRSVVGLNPHFSWAHPDLRLAAISLRIEGVHLDSKPACSSNFSVGLRPCSLAPALQLGSGRSVWFRPFSMTPALALGSGPSVVLSCALALQLGSGFGSSPAVGLWPCSWAPA